MSMSDQTKILVKKIDPRAIFPTRAYASDAGSDIYALADTTIAAGERQAISTGIAMAIPVGMVGLVWDKSGLAVKSGLTVLAGVLDAGFRGEILVIVFNTSREDYHVKAGQKIAQVLVQPVVITIWESVDELPEAARGVAGWGSTGLTSPNKPL
jgi:dUTP pyrophosphatase